MPVGLAIVHFASALALVPVTDRKLFLGKSGGRERQILAGALALSERVTLVITQPSLQSCFALSFLNDTTYLKFSTGTFKKH